MWAAAARDVSERMRVELETLLRAAMRDELGGAAAHAHRAEGGGGSSSAGAGAGANAARAGDDGGSSGSAKHGAGGGHGAGGSASSSSSAEGEVLRNIRLRLDLGSRPPRILGVRLATPSAAMASEPYAWCAEMRARWAGDGFLVVTAEVGRAFLSFDVSFSLRSISLEGELRLEVAPRQAPPYIGPCRLSFLRLPDVHFELQALGSSIDVMEMPFVERLISNFFRKNLFAGLTAPHAAAFKWADVASASQPHTLTLHVQRASPSRLSLIHI